MSEMDLIVTSIRKEYYKGKATKLSLPTPDGMIGILPHHEPYVSLVSKGELIIDVEGDEFTRIETLSGTVEVRPDNKVIVLLRSIENNNE